jgi:hypothetical protein
MPWADKMQDTQPITGVVVTCNESRRLRECLAGLQFCNQLVVIDLGSTGDCVAIAREAGAEVVSHERVPVVEQLQPFICSVARHDWILRIDPDEVVPSELVPALQALAANPGTTGMVRLPFTFFYCGKPLSTTRWGGVQYMTRFFHKGRVRLVPDVHRGIKRMKGFKDNQIDGTPRNVIRHYWADSFGQLREKHIRYIGQEGSARYAAGQRFSWGHWCREIVKALWDGGIRRRGFLGGLAAIRLSFFWAWYVGASLLSLRAYQARNPAAAQGR